MADDRKIPNPFHRIMQRMMETFAEHQWQAILRSFCLAMRDERKARMRAILELAIELDKIKKTSIFGTAFHEQIIEEIIQGDWKKAEEINGWLGEPEVGNEERQAEYLALWENYRAMVMAACHEATKREAGIKVEPD